MIDRESAAKLLRVLNTDDERKGISGEAIKAMLAQVLIRGLQGDDYQGPPLAKDKRTVAKMERFFDIVIQVAPPPPLPYTAADVAILARFSENEYTTKADEAKVGDLGIDDEIELQETRAFYRSIASDYLGIALLADLDNLTDAIKHYRNLDTADRENFGWGADIWDERRWYATING